MSKMMKLLNKVKSMEAHSEVSGQDQVVLGNIQEGYASDKQSYAQAAQGHNSSRQHNVMVNFSLVFMAFVAMIAVSSILMSYKVFTQMNMSRDMSQQMMSAYNTQGAKIADLEKMTRNMETDQVAQTTELKAQLSSLNYSMKQNQSEIKKLSADVYSFKSAVEDVKTSHRLMVEKYKELNQTVQTLQPNTAQ